MKVLITMYGDETLKDVDTPEGILRTMQAWGEFGEAAGAAGVLLACDALEAGHTATTVRVDGGRRHVTDGPFIETKEQLAGFILLEVRDLDDLRMHAVGRRRPGRERPVTPARRAFEQRGRHLRAPGVLPAYEQRGRHDDDRTALTVVTSIGIRR